MAANGSRDASAISSVTLILKADNLSNPTLRYAVTASDGRPPGLTMAPALVENSLVAAGIVFGAAVSVGILADATIGAPFSVCAITISLAEKVGVTENVMT